MEGWRWCVTPSDDGTEFTVRRGEDGPAAVKFWQATCPDARAWANYVSLNLNIETDRGAYGPGWQTLTPSDLAAVFPEPYPRHIGITSADLIRMPRKKKTKKTWLKRFWWRR